MAKRRQTLTESHPELALEWSDKNDLRPEDVGRGFDSFPVLWHCPAGHEYSAQVYNRVKGSKCPYCSGRLPIVGETDLATTHPELAAQWSDKNLITPSQISAGAKRKIWWICSTGHEWEAPMYSRKVGNGCPKCVSRHFPRVVSAIHSVTGGSINKTLDISWPGGNKFEVDILIDESTILEYDSVTFHKKRIEKDTEKTLVLLGQGYFVIRVREKYLPLLNITNDRLIQVVAKWSDDPVHWRETLRGIINDDMGGSI